MINLILLISVNNDFEITTQKGQRKRHPETDGRLQGWGRIQYEEDENATPPKALLCCLEVSFH